jgi:hypothetical protein
MTLQFQALTRIPETSIPRRNHRAITVHDANVTCMLSSLICKKATLTGNVLPDQQETHRPILKSTTGMLDAINRDDLPGATYLLNLNMRVIWSKLLACNRHYNL